LVYARAVLAETEAQLVRVRGARRGEIDGSRDAATAFSLDEKRAVQREAKMVRAAVDDLEALEKWVADTMRTQRGVIAGDADNVRNEQVLENGKLLVFAHAITRRPYAGVAAVMAASSSASATTAATDDDSSVDAVHPFGAATALFRVTDRAVNRPEAPSTDARLVQPGLVGEFTGMTLVELTALALVLIVPFQALSIVAAVLVWFRDLLLRRLEETISGAPSAAAQKRKRGAAAGGAAAFPGSGRALGSTGRTGDRASSHNNGFLAYAVFVPLGAFVQLAVAYLAVVPLALLDDVTLGNRGGSVTPGSAYFALVHLASDAQRAVVCVLLILLAALQALVAVRRFSQ
jgi:hypothetical protein